MGLNRLFMVKHVESGAVDENVFIMTMGTKGGGQYGT